MTSISTRGLDANAITHTPGGRGNSDGKLLFDEDFSEWLTGNGCSLDGIITPCGFISKMEGRYSGSYERCPNDNCGPMELAYHALDGGVTPFLGSLIATHDGIDYRVPEGIGRAAILDAMTLSIKNNGISGIAFSFNGGPINIGNVGTVIVNAVYAPIDPTGLASLSVGGSGFRSPPPQVEPLPDEPSADCLSALAAMGKDHVGYDRVMASAVVFAAANYPSPALKAVLMAIAIKESNGDPNAIQRNGGGRGLLQVDITQTPGKNYLNDPRSMTAAANIEISLIIINGEFKNFKPYGFSIDSASTAYMFSRIHNGGYFKKNKKVDQNKMRQMSTNTNPADFELFSSLCVFSQEAGEQ